MDPEANAVEAASGQDAAGHQVSGWDRFWSGVGAVSGGADNLAEDAARSASATGNTIKEGIYEFMSTSGRWYVGQSQDIDRRLAEHVAEGNVTLANANAAIRTEVLGGKLAREIREQMRIFDLGGVGSLQNKQNAIGKARKYLMPVRYQAFYR